MTEQEILEAAKEAGFIGVGAFMGFDVEPFRKFAEIVEANALERAAHEGWMAANSDCEDRVREAIRALKDKS